MPVSFKCSGCGKPMTAKEEHAGRRIKCGKCGTILTIPGAKPAQPAKIPVVVPEMERAEHEREEAAAATTSAIRRAAPPLDNPWIDPTFHQDWSAPVTDRQTASAAEAPSPAPRRESVKQPEPR